MSSVKCDAVPAEVDETHSHMQPVGLQETLNLAQWVTPPWTLWRNLLKICVKVKFAFGHCQFAHCRLLCKIIKLPLMQVNWKFSFVNFVLHDLDLMIMCVIVIHIMQATVVMLDNVIQTGSTAAEGLHNAPYQLKI